MCATCSKCSLPLSLTTDLQSAIVAFFSKYFVMGRTQPPCRFMDWIREFYRCSELIIDCVLRLLLSFPPCAWARNSFSILMCLLSSHAKRLEANFHSSFFLCRDSYFIHLIYFTLIRPLCTSHMCIWPACSARLCVHLIKFEPENAKTFAILAQ